MTYTQIIGVVCLIICGVVYVIPEQSPHAVMFHELADKCRAGEFKTETPDDMSFKLNEHLKSELKKLPPAEYPINNQSWNGLLDALIDSKSIDTESLGALFELTAVAYE
jgi:hypothetical protein